MRWARVPVVAQVVTVYVSILRATPLVTLLLLLFFALPNIGVPIGADLGRDSRADHEHLGLQLRGLARRADELPEGPVSRPRSRSACRASQRFRRIVLPQIWRVSLPGLVNEMSLLIKVTPVLAVVGVVDITRAAVRIGAQTYEPLPPFFVALAIYMPIVYAIVSRAAPDRSAGWPARRRLHDPRFLDRVARARICSSPASPTPSCCRLPQPSRHCCWALC